MPPANLLLRGFRQQRGMTVRDLAAKSGVSIATVSRIETGKRGGSLPTLAALAAALDIEPELLGGISMDGAA